MCAEIGHTSPKQDRTQTSGPWDVSLNTREMNLELTTHIREEQESLSASLTLLAAGFGLISDGCNFCTHTRTDIS